MRRAALWLIPAMLLAAFPLRAEDRINVVASFSILADFARNAGGERLRLWLPCRSAVRRSVSS